MKAILLGSLLAAAAIYLWGVVFWTVSPLPQRVARTTQNPVAAEAAFVEHFPEPGVYRLPGLDDDEYAGLHADDVIAIFPVNIADRLDKPGGTLAIGFLHALVAMLLMSLLMRLVGDALGSYGDRVVFVLLAGIVVAFWGRLAGVVWWSLPLPWQVWSAVYDVSTWLVAGLVLARFVVPTGSGNRA